MPSSLKDFRSQAQLGKGSYGSVMKVERVSDGQIYAMKEVNIRRLSPRERLVWRYALLSSALAGSASGGELRTSAATGEAAPRLLRINARVRISQNLSLRPQGRCGE